MKAAAMKTVSGALGTVLKNIENGLDYLEIKRRIETIQIITLQKSVRNYKELSVRQGSLTPGFNPSSSPTKDLKNGT